MRCGESVCGKGWNERPVLPSAWSQHLFTAAGGRRAGSLGKSTDCFSRGSQLKSQHSQAAHNHLPLQPQGSSTLFWPPWVLHACGAQSRASKTFVRMNKQIFKKEIKAAGDNQDFSSQITCHSKASEQNLCHDIDGIYKLET